jgi:hypothetical protein
MISRNCFANLCKKVPDSPNDYSEICRKSQKGVHLQYEKSQKGANMTEQKSQKGTNGIIRKRKV